MSAKIFLGVILKYERSYFFPLGSLRHLKVRVHVSTLLGFSAVTNVLLLKWGFSPVVLSFLFSLDKALLEKLVLFFSCWPHNQKAVREEKAECSEYKPSLAAARGAAFKLINPSSRLETALG